MPQKLCGSPMDKKREPLVTVTLDQEQAPPTGGFCLETLTFTKKNSGNSWSIASAILAATFHLFCNRPVNLGIIDSIVEIIGPGGLQYIHIP